MRTDQHRLASGSNEAMEPIYLPQFRDVSWRWLAYAASTLIIVAVVFAFVHDVELKQDVRAEIVSPSEIKIQGLSGLVSDIYVSTSARVGQGAPLFRLERDLSLAVTAGSARHLTRMTATSRFVRAKRNTRSARPTSARSWTPRVLLRKAVGRKSWRSMSN